MATKLGHWLHGLGSAIITGLSTTGLSALGVAGAAGAGMQVETLDWKQCAIITLVGGVVGMFAYLKQSPLPPEE